MPVRLVLADDHRIVLDGLRHLLAQEQGFAVLGAWASSGLAVKH